MSVTEYLKTKCDICTFPHSNLMHDVYTLEALKQNLPVVSSDTAFLLHGAIDIIEATIISGCKEQLYTAITTYLEQVHK